MKTKLMGLLSGTALACAVAAAPAMAGGMTNWNFYSLLNNQGYNNTDIGSSYDSFAQGYESVQVDSVSQKGSSAATDICAGAWCLSYLDLFAKNGGTAGEQGLGLAGDPYGNGGEIYYPNGIYVNTAGVSGHVTSFTLGSVQGNAKSGEGWAVLAANDTSSDWTLLGSGVGSNIVDFSNPALADYTNFIIAEPNSDLVNGSNDIVLMSMTTVPEPGTLALFGAGLLGCAFFVSRRRRTRMELM